MRLERMARLLDGLGERIQSIGRMCGEASMVIDSDTWLWRALTATSAGLSALEMGDFDGADDAIGDLDEALSEGCDV